MSPNFKENKVLAAMTTAVLAVVVYAAHSYLWTAKVTVSLDVPAVGQQIYDPSGLDAARFYFEENPDSALALKEILYDPKLANSQSVFTTALNDGDQFFITSQPSSMLTTATELFERLQALLINTAAASSALSARDDFMLRLIADTGQEQKTIAQYINQLPGNRLLVLQDSSNSGYTDNAYRYFLNEINKNWEITHYRFLFKDFRPDSFEPLLAHRFDALYVLGGNFQPNMGNIAQMFHQSHPNAPIVLTPWARSNLLYEFAGPAIKRMVILSHYPNSADDSAVANYLKRFEQRFGYQPLAISLTIRQALELLEQALAAGHSSPESIKRYLLSRPEQSTSLGTIIFDEYGDSVQPLHPVSNLDRKP